MQSRLEASAAGRALISVVILGALGAVLAVNLPDSQLKSKIMTWAAPYLRASGLDQDWGVFSDVRRISVYVEGRVEYSDGSVDVEQIPNRPGIHAYTDYRWQKYEEQLRLNDNDRLWRPYAHFLADRARERGQQPVRVSLVRRFADTLPPGPGPERRPWQEFTFYVLDLEESR